MAGAKTRPTDVDVSTFVASIPDPQQREDSAALVRLMAEVTGQPATMWGPSIVGFGLYRYKGASGRGGDFFVIGFSPRKQAMTLYLPGLLHLGPNLLSGLGKHSLGKGCLYVKRLSDVDQAALRRVLEASINWHKTADPSVA